MRIAKRFFKTPEGDDWHQCDNCATAFECEVKNVAVMEGEDDRWICGCESAIISVNDETPELHIFCSDDCYDNFVGYEREV